MSVRTEPRDLSAQLQQTLTIPAEVMAAQNPQMAMVPAQTGMEVAAPAGPTDTQLHEANSFNTNNEHHPLERTVCINIRASLSDLCLRANTATWAPPSAEATKAIFQQARPGTRHSNRALSPHRPQAASAAAAAAHRHQRQPLTTTTTTNPPTRHAKRAAHCADRSSCGRRAQRKFLDLGGSAENQGDLKSVVLHKMTLGAQKSTFPVALGVRITGVDDKAYSQTGESYSMITMPNADSHQSRVLQEDNTDLAYEFARKFVRRATQTHSRATQLTTLRVRSPAGLHRRELGHERDSRGGGASLLPRRGRPPPR